MFSLETQALALDIFRSKFGVAARPEDHPALWTEALEDADGVLEQDKLYEEEGN